MRRMYSHSGEYRKIYLANDLCVGFAMGTKKGVALMFDAHSSALTPVFLTSREETQTMVQAKLRPKLRPPQTLGLPRKGETQTMV